MALDLIMLFGSFVFGLLFVFIFLMCVVVITASFKMEKRISFEPPVSVIIPCYNEECRIGDCLDSIYASNYPRSKLEIVVVDDGSTDDTINVIKEHAQGNLKIIRGNHEGKSESLNIGVRAASNEIVLTLDADTTIKKDAIGKIVCPFSDRSVGATNGSCLVKNNQSFLGIFQNIEYHYNNLIRMSFSRLFRNGVWFFGAFACYRRSVLAEIGYFKKDTLTEDMDTALEICSKGHRVVNVHNALGYTVVPSTFKALFNQRIRWWAGVLQSLKKSKKLFSSKSDASLIFLFINQYWWSFFALVSIPLIICQFSYWLPFNVGSFFDFFGYTFRWFTLAGPVYYIYMLPEWGVSVYGIFGVLSGLVSSMLIVDAIYVFKDRLTFRNFVGLFLYFPYTIVLNIIIAASIFKITFLKDKYFKY